MSENLLNAKVTAIRLIFTNEVSRLPAEHVVNNQIKQVIQATTVLEIREYMQRLLHWKDSLIVSTFPLELDTLMFESYRNGMTVEEIARNCNTDYEIALRFISDELRREMEEWDS